MQAHRLPARQGMVWVIAGYRLFRANPPLLIILTFLYLMVFTMMLVLPPALGRVLAPLLQPLITLVIANGCRSIASKGRQGPPPDLTVGIRTHARQLLQLGALQLVGWLIVALILFVLDVKADPTKPDQMLPVLLLMTALSAPLVLIFWFAPLLTGWHNVPPLKSAFFSVVASARNWRAFVTYALTLAALALIPALLAVLASQVSDTYGQIVSAVVEIAVPLLVLPVVLAGTYVSYRDIFQAND